MDGEKRRNSRFPSFTEVSYVHGEVPAQGRISDLSEGGFFIDTLNPLPKGSRITFRFTLPGDKSEVEFKGEAEVVWVRPMQGMGLHFTRLPLTDQERLRAALNRK